MNNVARNLLVNALTLVALLFVISQYAQMVQAENDASKARWTRQAEANQREYKEFAKIIVSEQMSALGCTMDTDGEIVVPQGTPLAVRGAHTDTNVVTVLPFDEAVSKGRSGAVWVIGSC